MAVCGFALIFLSFKLAYLFHIFCSKNNLVVLNNFVCRLLFYLQYKFWRCAICHVHLLNCSFINFPFEQYKKYINLIFHCILYQTVFLLQYYLFFALFCTRPKLLISLFNLF